jgi:hypothetical protein
VEVGEVAAFEVAAAVFVGDDLVLAAGAAADRFDGVEAEVDVGAAEFSFRPDRVAAACFAVFDDVVDEDGGDVVAPEEFDVEGRDLFDVAAVVVVESFTPLSFRDVSAAGPSPRRRPRSLRLWRWRLLVPSIWRARRRMVW